MDLWRVIPQLFQQQMDERWRAAVRAQMTVMNRTPPVPPYHRELLDLARTLIHEGRYDLAVIVAQMACEVLTEQTLTPLLAGRKAWNFNVDNKKTRKLYVTLTHDAIDAEPFWTSFTTHATRRHEVVHRSRLF